MDKSIVRAALEEMDDEFSFEEVIEKLIFIEKVQKRSTELEESKKLPLSKAKERINQICK